MLDMEFLFECSFCSLSSECSKLVRCWSHEEKLNIFKQPIVLFCPLNTFLFTYWWQRFWQYSEDFRTPLKITSHCWGPNYVVLINKFKYSLRNLFCNHSNHDFFTCKRYINMLFFMCENIMFLCKTSLGIWLVFIIFIIVFLILEKTQPNTLLVVIFACFLSNAGLWTNIIVWYFSRLEFVHPILCLDKHKSTQAHSFSWHGSPPEC